MEAVSSASKYSALDRFLHRLALGNLELQKSIADMEDRMHSAALRQIVVQRPVFITSLPRAGTTLLLELLVGTGAFAAHTYREMPFVLCPMTWRSISGGFRRKATLRERAHGDGMEVGFDSPEAFEEVIWKAFWPRKYRPRQIGTWSAADCNAEFEAAFRDHIRKLIALRSDGEKVGSKRYVSKRYVSKNNANIARLPLLATLFPDCRIVIPFRKPGAHAASIARQHANFLSLHARDSFSRKYMEWIGHYEFGLAFRPFAFCGTRPEGEPDLEYWLDYWARAYTFVLETAPRQAVFLDYDRLLGSTNEILERLASILEIPAGPLIAATDRLRAPAQLSTIPESDWSVPLRETYDLLRQRAM
jgi:hypothetical protein